MDIPELDEATDYFVSKAVPAATGVVGAKGVAGSISDQTETNNWIIGGVGFFIGVAMVNSGLGDIGKSLGTGVAIGSTWELLNAIVAAFTQYNSFEELIYSPATGSNGGS